MLVVRNHYQIVMDSTLHARQRCTVRLPVQPAGLAGPPGAILSWAAERALGVVEWDNLRGTDHSLSDLRRRPRTSAVIDL